MQSSTQVSNDIREVSDLWLDGEPPSEFDLRAARSLAARLGSFEGVRPFSAVVQSLVEHVSRPDFDLNQVCRLIEMDPALASRILRVANSAAYRGLGPCASVAQAVVRIGATNISGLSFVVDNIDAVQTQARDKAIQDAKQKAAHLSQVLGVKLNHIVNFSDDSAQPIYQTNAMSLSAAVGSAAPVVPQIQTGQNKITSNVSISYEVN